MLALARSEETAYEEVQTNLLVPGDARYDVVSEMTGLSPGASAQEQTPEPHPETASAVAILQRHEVVFAKLPETVRIETDVRKEHQEREKNKDRTKAAVKQVSVGSVIESAQDYRDHPAACVKWSGRWARKSLKFTNGASGRYGPCSSGEE